MELVDGWILSGDGRENLAFHHEGVAEREAVRENYKNHKIKAFKYINTKEYVNIGGVIFEKEEL